MVRGSQGLKSRRRKASAAAIAYGLVLAAGFALVLWLNLPGHMSYDSVIALAQGRTGLRETWAPATIAWLLGVCDRLVRGTSLYLALVAAVLFLALWSLRSLRPRTSWLAVAAALAAILTPQLLLYQGIVWRDVLFANFVVAGFVCLAHAARNWGARPIVPLLGGLVLIAAAATVRQNGVILVVAAAAAVGWTALRAGWKAAAGWSLGYLAAAGIAMAAISLVTEPPRVNADQRPGVDILILQHYDLVGVVAQDPKIPLPAIAAADRETERLVRLQSPQFYSAARVDTLDQAKAMGRALWHLPDPVMHAQWAELLTEHPGAYLKHRIAVFHWLLAPPDLRQCLPAHAGVAGPDAMLKALGLTAGYDRLDNQVLGYVARFFDTPVYSHVTYLVAALVMAIVLLFRRDPSDVVIAALLLGAVAFTTSFFLISLACDYRYLYLLDLAAITGALYLALDPTLRRTQRVSG